MHGELHAVIHPDIPRITNVGFLVDGSVFHPGDALTVPDQPVDTLMLPVMAPWNKISEVIDYVREVKPRRAIDIHDALLTDLARPIYDSQIGALGGAEHARLTPGGLDASCDCRCRGGRLGCHAHRHLERQLDHRPAAPAAGLAGEHRHGRAVRPGDQVHRRAVPRRPSCASWATSPRSTPPAGGTGWR